MTLETLRRLIDKHGAHCTLADAIIREGGERLRTRLGLPLDASDAQVDASLAQQFSEVFGDRSPFKEKGT
jgi:hypothetical protein